VADLLLALLLAVALLLPLPASLYAATAGATSVRLRMTNQYTPARTTTRAAKLEVTRPVRWLLICFGLLAVFFSDCFLVLLVALVVGVSVAAVLPGFVEPVADVPVPAEVLLPVFVLVVVLLPPVVGLVLPLPVVGELGGVAAAASV